MTDLSIRNYSTLVMTMVKITFFCYTLNFLEYEEACKGTMGKRNVMQLWLCIQRYILRLSSASVDQNHKTCVKTQTIKLGPN